VVDAEGFPVAGATVEIAGTDVFNMPVSITHLSEEISDAHFDWARESENVLIPAGELGVMLGPVPPIPLGDVVPMEGRRLTTDERGYFVVDNVPPGQAVVLARHPDHMDGKSDVLALAPDARVKTTVVLGKGEPLRGRVLDHRGFPVQNARIQISAPGFDRRVTAESDGTFSLAAAPKDVTLRISRIEQPLRVVFAREVDKKERAEEIQIELPKPREEAVISVIDSDKEPIELAQVSVVSLDRQVPFKKTLFTDDEGRATFEETAGLRVRLTVSAPSYVEKSVEATLRASSSVTLTQSLVATGRVLGVRGRLPASGAAVVFRSGSVRRTAIADELGEYRLVGIPPGTGELSASHPEHGKGEKKVDVRKGTDDRPAQLPDLIVAPTLEVTGRVVDERGDPLAGAVIATSRLSPYLPAGGAGAILGTSDERGEFKVDVRREPGTYLYAALLGRAFGFSDGLPDTDLDRIGDVDIVIDREDRIPPHEHGTVLIAIEDRPQGILVYAVAESSEAKKAGLRADDFIVEVEGTGVEDAERARELLSGLPGTDARLIVRRAGRSIELLVARETFMR
jgi:protocatechuate 3,4-dioxygenase beta subunit